MDSHDFIDTVKVEKANAIARYRWFRNLSKLLQLLEAFVALALISWSSKYLPSLVKLSGSYLLEFSIYVLNPHVVFFIGNAIVFALFVLSRHIDAGNISSTAEDQISMDAVESEPSPLRKAEEIVSTADFYGVEKSVQKISGAAVEAPVTSRPVPEEMIVEVEKRIVCKENVVDMKQIQKFERTQSEKLKRQKPLKELRRTETEVRRVISVGDRRSGVPRTAFERVDTMSSEEFRLTVEAFIEKQQKFLRQQKIAEVE